MRIQLEDRARLFQTFAFYLVILAVPLAVLVYQGMTSLEKQRRQQEANMEAKLRDRATTIVDELAAEWRLFVEKEKLRFPEEYQPVTITDQEAFAETDASPRRSPLYAETVNNLAKLDLANLATVEDSVSASLPAMGESLRDSLIGYFQYDYLADRWTTPYDQVPPYITHEEQVLRYRLFLEHELEPGLISQIGPVGEPLAEPLRILRYLKVSKVSTPEYEAPRRADGPKTLIYSPIYFTYRYNLRPLIIGFRPVLLEYPGTELPDELLFQGYIFSADVLQLEIQAQLERFQEEFGDLYGLIGEPNLESAVPLAFPFQEVSIHWRLDPTEESFAAFKAERQRFWAVIGLLLLSLTVTLVHSSRLVFAHMDLYRKKNNFISAVTHELKAPLTSIIMYAEMLEEGWARGKEQKYYHYIHWESERLTRLIKNILDFSGLERGTFKLSPTCTVLSDLVRSSLEPLRVWTENSGLTLALEVAAEPEVMVDRDSLAQVIYNLCDNTIKYGMSAEQPTLNLEIRESDSHGVLLVYDNGPGIPKEVERRIFERFFRVENEMTRERTGTGLGLALVKELIEGNGGRIEPFTPSGGGFGIRILLKKAPISAMAA